MDKKTEAQRVWIITWLVQGGMRFNFRAAGMHSQRAFQPMPPSFETLLGPEGSWINPFPSLVLSFLMCKTEIGKPTSYSCTYNSLGAWYHNYTSLEKWKWSHSVVLDSLWPHEPQFPESTQTHVHWVSDAIQPSHPLSSPSPPAFNLSQNQGLFKWVSFPHQLAKVWEFQLQHQSLQWTPRTNLL